MRILLLTTLLLASVSCSSNPTIIPETQPTKVSLKNYGTGEDFFLVNEAHTNLSDYYSTMRNDADTKVIRNIEMGALMMQLEDFDFFKVADASFRRTPGARTTLMVDRGGNKYSLSMSARDTGSEIQYAEKCNSAFRAVYNANVSMQLINNPGGTNIFEEQQRKLNRNHQGLPR
jgi:hypothetical protein